MRAGLQELAHEEVVRSLHMEHAKQASKLRQELEQQVICFLKVFFFLSFAFNIWLSLMHSYPVDLLATFLRCSPVNNR